MRTPTLIIILLASIVSISTTANGQEGSGEFVSGIGRFGFSPGVPIVDAKPLESVQGPFVMLGEAFSFADDSSVFVISHYTPFEPKKFGGNFSAASKTALTASVRKDLIADFQKNNATFTESTFVSGAVKGSEYHITGSRRSIVRIFFIGNRFYILLATSLNKQEFGRLSATLDTFRHLPKQEFAAAMIKEGMPAELPQTTPSGILPTDALEMGLKGRVKTIIEDMESGTPKKRERNAEFYFSKNGFMTRHITYANGLADVINNYGWVDGRRSVNVGPIKYFGEPFSFGTASMTVGLGAREGYNYLGRDLDGRIVDQRYTSRFEEKYDDSWRLTERKNVSSHGDLNFVERHTYNGLTRTVRVEDNSGGFISSKKEILDTAGNVIEENTLDDSGKANSTKGFKYQFDASGNWIVKAATVQSRVSGPKTVRHLATYYRTITYHD
jgi:hypothetical protein